jgi:hypothetical protein
LYQSSKNDKSLNGHSRKGHSSGDDTHGYTNSLEMYLQLTNICINVSFHFVFWRCVSCLHACQFHLNIPSHCVLF